MTTEISFICSESRMRDWWTCFIQYDKHFFNSTKLPGSVGVSFEIHRLHLCRGLRLHPTPDESLEYNKKQSEGEAPVMVEIWGIRITPSLSSFPSQLWPWVVALDRALYMGQIELNSVVILTELFEIKVFLHLTVWKQKTVLMLNWFFFK